jgi:lysozyme family protein
MGHGQGIKLLQRACWALTGQMGVIKDDGILGELTISLANAFGLNILPVLRGSRAEFYRGLKKDMFLNGWLKRTYEG